MDGTVEDFWNFYGLAVRPRACHEVEIHSYHDDVELTAAYRLLRVGDRVLVAGGGFGALSLLLALHLGAENVVTYEANPDLVRLALYNIGYRWQSLDFRHGALSARTEERDFHLCHAWVASSLEKDFARLGEIVRTVRVPCINVNEALRRDGLNTMVLDVEGSEYEIMAALDFSLLRALVVELHGEPDDIERGRAMAAGHMPQRCQAVKPSGVHVYGFAR